MAKTEVPEKWVLMTELNGEPLLHHFKLSSFGNVVIIRKGVSQEEEFQPKDIGGYKYISFTTRKGSRETIYLHRLVAEFFIEEKDPDKSFVIHLDYNRWNNRYDNLMWATQKILYKHRAAKTGRWKKTTPTKKVALNPEAATNETRANESSLTKKFVSEALGILQ